MMPASARNYGELRRVLAARRQALGLTPSQVDSIGGLPKWFTARFERGNAHLSEPTTARLLVALGVRLYLQTRSD